MANSEVECPTCHKKYAIGPEMAGKRVRCRQCANLFEVPFAEPEPELIADDDAPSAMEPEPTAAAPAVFDFGAPVVAAQFEEAFTSNPIEETYRPNTRFKFPWAAQLDEWLPIALVTICATWVVYQTFRSETVGPLWAGLLRLTVVFGLYLLVVVPGVIYGVRRASAKLRFALPPAPGWRAAAVFALPLAMAYVFWVITGSFGMFIVGCLIGLCFAAGGFYLLFRLRPAEMGLSYAAASGGFTGAIGISIVLMIVLNFLLNAAMKSANAAGNVPGSPLGPSFAWTVPPAPQPSSEQNDPKEKEPAPRSQLASSTQPPVAGRNVEPVNPPKDSAGSASTSNADNARTAIPRRLGTDPENIGQPVNSTLVAAKDGNSKSGPTPASAIAGGERVASKQPGAGTVFDLPPDMIESQPQPAAPQHVEAGTAAWLKTLQSKALPFVKEAQTAAEIGLVNDVVYPCTASSWIAVIHHKDAQQDQIDVMDAQTFAPAGSASMARESTGNPACRQYALSPDGLLLARPARFPKVGFPVWSLKEQRILSIISPLETPRPSDLIGFADNDHLICITARGQQEFLEIYSVKSGKRMSSSPFPIGYAHTPGNGELSPDGKYFVIAARSNAREADLFLYGLANPSPKKLPISSLDARWVVQPSGIAFSSDGSRVAALFAQHGEGFITAWNLKGPAKEITQLCPTIPAQLTREALAGGRLFDWIGNNAWLVGGDAVIDAGNGRLLGNLSDESVRSQHMVGDDLQLLFNSGKAMRVASIRLDPTKLAGAVSSTSR
jgi:hypothetical protein